jgi:release factor glutamine methyltransferase
MIIHSVYNKKTSQPFDIEGNLYLFNMFTHIPHPDTLELISIAKEIIETNTEIQTIADVGTGSGFIAIELAKSFTDKSIIASDISGEALEIARENAKKNAVTVHFLQNTDHVWLSELKGRTIDMIVSNPPFAGKTEYESAAFKQEYPEINLEPEYAVKTTDPDGLEPYISMIKNASQYGVKVLLFHCNSLSIYHLSDIAHSTFPNSTIKTYRDVSGHKRFLLIHIQ